MQKGLSVSKFVEDHRSSLYYNQYEYAVTLIIHNASCLRNLYDIQFEQAIKQAKAWDSVDRNRKKPRLDKDPWAGTTRETALREVRNILLAEGTSFKTMISFNVITIYTNNKDLARTFRLLGNDGVQPRLVRQAVLSRPAGVIQLKQSRHGYRTYLKERPYNKDQRTLLLNFLNQRADTLRVSNSLKDWLSGRSIWGRNQDYSRSYYFVDHDHPNEGTMLGLVMPGCVRKTMPIEIAK